MLAANTERKTESIFVVRLYYFAVRKYWTFFLIRMKSMAERLVDKGPSVPWTGECRQVRMTWMHRRSPDRLLVVWQFSCLLCFLYLAISVSRWWLDGTSCLGVFNCLLQLKIRRISFSLQKNLVKVSNLLRLNSPLQVSVGHAPRFVPHRAKPVELTRFFDVQSRRVLPFLLQSFEQTIRLPWRHLHTAGPNKHHELPVWLPQPSGWGRVRKGRKSWVWGYILSKICSTKTMQFLLVNCWMVMYGVQLECWCPSIIAQRITVVINTALSLIPFLGFALSAGHANQSSDWNNSECKHFPW